MIDISEKHYSIDAGIGEKMEGCPYSLYSDGHDVQDYIIPPKGYTFKGFRFEPSDNRVYDGKLVAQFEKEPLKERMASVFHILAWIIVASIIIGLITILLVGIFKPQKPHTHEPRPVETPSTVNSPLVETSNTLDGPEETNSVVEATQPVEVQPVEQQPTIEEQQPVTETTQTPVIDDNMRFKQDFWNLIHQREQAMDAYDGLYKQYKGKVSGEEYDYLRFTVLKDYSSYKTWNSKLRKIQPDELAKIDSVNALTSKLKEVN